jgi:peptide chain release factor 1
MLEKLAGIEGRYEELNRLLNEVGEDYKTAAEYAKERSDLEPIVLKSQEYRKALKELEEARGLQFS